MSLILIVLVLLLIFGGFGYHRGYYGNEGIGIIGLVLIFLVLVWLFGGGLHIRY